MSARRNEREAPTAAAVPPSRGDDEVQPASASPTAASAPAGASGPRQDDAPDGVGTVPQARAEGSAGGRPADVAREALRTARREALRAEADEAARQGTRVAEPRVRHQTRATGNPGSPVPSAGSGPDAASRAARLKAAQDMRHYLANAFRMPTWSDTPEDDTSTVGAGDTTGNTDSAEPRRTPASTASPHPPLTDSAEPRPTPAAPAGHPTPTESATPHTPPATATPATPHLTTPHPATPPATTLPATAPPSTAPHPTAPPSTAPHPTAPPSTAPHPTTPSRSTPASPHVPPTMATPHRDTELRRTFAAFGAREAGAGEVPFAATWWGNAWVEALEQGALDPKRLARGRGYADQGHVDAITVTPGLVLAYVRGSRPRPYRVQVRVRTLEDEDWARFLEVAADRPGHIAALLDKELPHSLADCGVPLLPGPGDLVPRCSCPDSGHPCKHAAALCYQTARLLDADPFVLLLLRGRGEKDLLDALSRRSAARAARAAQERQPQSLPGVRATDVLAPRALPPLPPPLPAPPHPEQPPVYPAAPGGPDPFALDQLATDAAARAHALLGTGRDPVGELTLWQDAVRLAAARPGSGLTAATRTLYAALATAAGRTPADLARAVAAWRQGGLAGLAVLEEPWDPPAGRFDRARPLLLAADLPAFRPWRNRLTHPRGHVQLRLGREGLWYAYESEPGHDDWWPRGTPDLDPVGALTGLGTPDAT
ncbi:SWIM zinc finger family protein [Streptomyces sp. NPDC049099]|uniref:SWIM zinc finger family protein n=1 Tax=Streptomyces sp. NPDC049099 TaxID=3155768 RepID=UPI0034316AF4